MRTIIKAAAAASAFLVLAACGGGQGSVDADPDKPVTIDVTVSNATEPYVIPWLVAKDQGFFEERGVIVDEIIPSKGGSTTVRNMLSGDLPFADVGFPSVIESVEAGAPVSVVAGSTQSAYPNDFYAMADNTSVQNIEDIKIWAYTNPESVTQALTFMLPKAAGLTGPVERVSSGGGGEGVALLESGDVDVAVVPPTVLAKNPGKFREVVSSADFLKEFQQSVITTTPEYAKSHPLTVKAVVAGYQEAVDWIAKNPAEAAKTYANYTDIDAAAAEEIVKKALSFNQWGTGFNADAIKAALEAKQAAGFKGEVDLCEMFDPAFLPEGATTKLPVECK